MKIDRFIYSTDENPSYIYSWPLVSLVTQKIFGCKASIAFITNKGEKDDLVLKMKRFGDVFLYKPINNIPIGNQAKVSRMFITTLFPNEICVINDVDLLPLQKNFLTEILSGISSDCLVAIGSNAYLNSSESGKFPMVYTTATGNTFSEIINPNKLSYEDAIKKWINIKVFSDKEAINNPHSKFSDESLLRALIQLWKNKNKVIYRDRLDFVGMRATKRIDRLGWNINRNALFGGWYIDAHLPRPITRNIGSLKPILDFFGLSEKEILL